VTRRDRARKAEMARAHAERRDGRREPGQLGASLPVAVRAGVLRKAAKQQRREVLRGERKRTPASGGSS
jgi:hypothetical protein